MADKNKLIIITAPSGAGKTSITRHLMKTFPQLAFSISAATRQPRGTEKDGVDYHFISTEEFQNKIHNKEFMEWEMVYEDKYYGTLKSEMERLWSLGKVAILDIDVKGAIHVQKQYPENSLSIFIEPPSVDELKKRLQGRGLDDEQNIITRVNKANYEITFKHSFDALVVNDNFEKACAETENAIVKFINQ